VHAKGGDGCTLLHFARHVEIAGLLTENGTRGNARDEDHDSMPEQWLTGGAPDVVRFCWDKGQPRTSFWRRRTAIRIALSIRRQIALLKGHKGSVPAPMQHSVRIPIRGACV